MCARGRSWPHAIATRHVALLLLLRIRASASAGSIFIVAEGTSTRGIPLSVLAKGPAHSRPLAFGVPVASHRWKGGLVAPLFPFFYFVRKNTKHRKQSTTHRLQSPTLAQIQINTIGIEETGPTQTNQFGYHPTSHRHARRPTPLLFVDFNKCGAGGVTSTT